MDRRSFLVAAGAGIVGAAAGVGGASAVAVNALKQRRLEDRESKEISDAAAVGQNAPTTRRIVYGAQTSAQVIALTFDDGPDPEFTPRVLEILGARGIKATFDVMGYNAQKHTDELVEEVRAGHEIGNHTWTHLDLAFQSPRETRFQLERGREVIESLAEVRTRYFRPPRGEVTGAAARIAVQMGYDVLLWSIDGYVNGRETPREVFDHVLASLEPGGILAFHDGIGRGTFDRRAPFAQALIERREAEIQALPDVLDAAIERGYRFVSLDELLSHDEPADRPPRT